MIPALNDSIAVRDYDPKLDEGYVYKCWLRDYRKAFENSRVTDAVYYPWKSAEFGEILERATIQIAYPKVEPHVIVGFSITEPDVLHWVMTRSTFRRLGIARGLISIQFPNPQPLSFTYLGPCEGAQALCAALIRDGYSLTHDPRKRRSNGNDTGRKSSESTRRTA